MSAGQRVRERGSRTSIRGKLMLRAFVRRSEGRGDEVRDLWLRGGPQLADGILNDPVRIGHAIVLPEMLKPGCEHEGLEKASFFGRILEDVPSVSAITPAL